MRRSLAACGLAALALAVLGTPSFAQETLRRGDVTVGMDLGWAGFGSSAVEPSGFRVSLFGDWAPVRTLALEADVTCLVGMLRGGSGDSSEVGLCAIGVGAKLHFPTSGRLAPYVRVGAAYETLDIGTGNSLFEANESGLALEAGAGVRWQMGTKRRWALRLDARFIRSPFFGKQETNGSVAAGVIYRLGNRK